MKTLDRKISSLKEQLKKLNAERQTLYEEYWKFLANSNLESAIRILDESEKKFKNSSRFRNLLESPQKKGEIK